MLLFSVLSISAATKLTATPSTNMTTNESYVITNVTDGNYNTKFYSGAAQVAGQYILLTLDNTYNLGTITIYFSTGDKPASSKIQYSTDNSQWNDVPGGTVNSSGSSFSCDATGVEARYVRLYLTGGSSNWLQIAEFEVYEADATKTLSPVFNPESKVFNEGESGEITITSADADAVIYYTIDGTEPTTSSESIVNGGTVFVPTDDWTKSTTVKAIAKTESKDASNVVSATYTVVSPYCQPTVPTQGTGSQFCGLIHTFTTTGAEEDASWTNPYWAEKEADANKTNGYPVVINAFTAKAGQTITLNIVSAYSTWGAIRVYADLNGNYQFDDNENIARVGKIGPQGDDLPVVNNVEFTIDAATSAGTYLMRVFIVASSTSGDVEYNKTNPCDTYTQGGYYDFAFNVEADAPVPTEDKEVTADDAETGDAAYVNVAVTALAGTQAPTWTIGGYAISAQALNIEVAADATTPEISISDGGSITADQISVKRTVKADEWAFMSLPFAITVDNGSIQVGGAAAVINDNIKFLVYDGALRASSSIELFSGSGWTAKESGTIDANTGFAVAINSNNGDEQVVTFSATSFSMDASDKAVSLESHEATVNGGIDADWNFKGNPMLQSASKDEGYSLYIYNPSDDTYSEYSAAELAIFSPFAAWFVQSTGLTNRTITFSHDGTTVAADVESNIDGRFAISINGGEDEARITVLNGSSESYVINEDAMYFAPNSNKVAQVYMIDGDGAKIASSVVPAPYDEVKLAYNAAVAGAQTLTVTSVIPGTAVYLVDNEEGTETLMNEGSEYSFTSEAGLNSERFAVKTIIDVTGIEENTAETSSVSAVVVGDAVKIYGATAGETIDVYTVNGVLVSSAVAVEGENEISVPAQGVLIVKVGDEVVKIVK